jgi:hypothetical protein
VDPAVSSSPARPDLPGGIVATRRAMRRLGGFVTLAGAAALWLAATAVDAVVPGTIGGIVSFIARVMAVPFLPVFGVPVATESWRLGAAMTASALMWWVVGAAAGRRATAKVVAGWREFSVESALLAAGTWIGALASFGLAALVSGVA